MNLSRFASLPVGFLIAQAIIVALRMALAAICRWRQLEKFYPATCAYFYVGALRSVGLFMVATLGSNSAYFTAYYISAALDALTTGLVLAEIYLKVYGPRWALPIRAFRTAVIVIPGAVVVSIVLASVPGSMKGDLVGRMLWTMQQGISASSWAGLIAMILYSQRLGISWSARVAGLARGMVVMLTASMLVAIALSRGSKAMGTTAVFVTQLMAIACLGMWLRTFWEKEEQPARLTQEQRRRLHEEILRCAREIAA